MATEPFLIGAGNGVGNKIPSDKPIAVVGPLVSILIPCCGQLEYTKLLLPSLLKYTRQPYELIFLDIGSLDGTAEYLAGIATAANCKVEVVRAGTDLDIGPAIAEAMRRARGEFFALLNNDVVVTQGWLDKMLALIGMSPRFGIVGPMTNYAFPPQKVDAVPYRIGPKKNARAGHLGSPQEFLVDTGAVDAFARKHYDELAGKWIEAERLGGFCMVLRRDLLNRIGPPQTDEQFGVFDTDLLCAKARQAGFTLVLCRDVFIHHFGTRTFAQGAPTEPSLAGQGTPVGSGRPA